VSRPGRLKFIALVAGCCISAAWTAWGTERVALKDSIVTHKDAVSLNDFLPTEAAENIRELAARVVLGKAPLPGERRTFDREQVLRAMRAEREIVNLVAVPETLEVTRWSRPVTREEIARAIESTYHGGKSGEAAMPSGADITIAAATYVAEDAPKFRILRMEASPNDSRTRLQLWTASEPRTPPFWVSVDRPIESFTVQRQLMNAASTLKANNPISVGATSSETPVVVKAGTTVEVALEGRGMRIATKGVALNPGREGGVIRVRAAVSGKVLSGTVTNSGTVVIQF
jgi:hypothetical protein